MKIEKQVSSPKTSLRLLSKGVKLTSLYGWVKVSGNGKTHFILKKTSSEVIFRGFIHAYTLAELGEMIPWGFFQSSTVGKMPGGIWCAKSTKGSLLMFDSEVEARAMVVIDLLETKSITSDQVNHPDLQNQPVIRPKDVLPQKR